MSDRIKQFSHFDKIRRYFDNDSGIFWYAVVDVVEILTESVKVRDYWYRMKKREPELEKLLKQFPMKNRSNGRTYRTDCAHEEGLLRIIQSISSPKAEPFKQWLAMTGARRLDEIRNDPIELEREKYRLQGYDESWINARLESRSVRNELTDEWTRRGVKEGIEFGILTNEIHKGTFDDMSVKDHKDLKDLKKGSSLRDHMSPIELAFTILGEATTIDEVQQADSQGFEENRLAAKKGGETSGKLRKVYEDETGRQVISDQSYLEERKRLSAGQEEEETEEE
ncbi:MAG: BRO family protein [Chloroflexota bacterium]